MTSTFYPPYHLGGDAVHVEYLAKELVKKGHEVHIFHSLDAYFIKRRQFPEKSETDGVFLHTFKTCLGVSPYATYLLGNSPSVIKEFGVLTRELKPEVVHHHNISLLGYSVLRKYGEYLNLYTAHDYWLICQQSNLLKNKSETCNDGSCVLCSQIYRKPPQLWRLLGGFKKALSSIDLIIAPSDYVRRRLSERINARFITIPNFAPFPPSVLPTLDLEDYFLYVGVLERHKGIQNLLETFKEISKVSDARLVIVGDGNLKNYVKSFIESNSLSNSILYLGSIRKTYLYALYREAKALIVPSIWPENAPLVTLEALSMGTPVIASNVGGMPEIINQVDPNLVFEDQAGLKKLISSFSKKEFSSEKIKEIYEQNFSPAAYVSRYMRTISKSEEACTR